MSFSQWFKDVASNSSISLDVITPLIGASSLNFTTTTTSSSFGGYTTPTGASGLVKGIEQGRLRTLMANDASSGGGNAMGFCVIGSADTLATVLGSYYRFEVFSTGASASYSLLRSNNSGLCLSGTPGTVLASGSSLLQNPATMYPFQFEFIVDTVNLGGVYLAISRGTSGSSDFSTLATLIQYVDSSASKLITSNSEGLYARTSGTFMLDVRMDQTSLYTLT